MADDTPEPEGRKRRGDDVADGEVDDDASSGSKKKLILLALIAAAVGFAAFTFLGGGADAVEDPSTTTTTTTPPGNITTIDSLTLNLADGRFLKVGMAFEVDPDVNYPSAAAAVDPTTRGFAREIDHAITTLSSFTYEQLVGPAGKAEAKQAILERAEVISGGAVTDVYFHEFVMQ